MRSGLLAAGAMAAFGLAGPALAQSADCREQAGGDHFIQVENVAPRPGTALAIGPMRIDGPFGLNAVDRRCVRDWRVSPRGAARLSHDRTRLILDDDVAPGTRIAIEARVRDVVTSATVTVVGATDASLLGGWTRNCPAPEGSAPIERLVIQPADYFLFDSEGRQWSGSYQFDPQTGRIAFGPYVLPSPDRARLEGEARVDGDTLTLDGVFFADTWGRPAGEDCPMVFQRVVVRQPA